MTPEQTLSHIRQKASIAVLLLSSDELSVRAHQTLLSHEGKLRGRGIQISILEVSPRTSTSEELACVRVPQLRVFSHGKLQQQLVGVFDSSDIDSVLRTLP